MPAKAVQIPTVQQQQQQQQGCPLRLVVGHLIS